MPQLHLCSAPFVDGTHLPIGLPHLPMSCLSSCQCLGQGSCSLVNGPYIQSLLSYISGFRLTFRWRRAQHATESRAARDAVKEGNPAAVVKKDQSTTENHLY
jgi:hypothetical protein